MRSSNIVGRGTVNVSRLRFKSKSTDDRTPGGVQLVDHVWIDSWQGCLELSTLLGQDQVSYGTQSRVLLLLFMSYLSVVKHNLQTLRPKYLDTMPSPSSFFFLALLAMNSLLARAELNRSPFITLAPLIPRQDGVSCVSTATPCPDGVGCCPEGIYHC